MTAIRFRTPLAVSVETFSVRFRTRIRTSIQGPPLHFTTPLKFSIEAPRVRFRTALRVGTTYGVRFHTYLRAAVNAYTGTGLHRTRRGPAPVVVGTGPLQPGLTPPADPPTPTTLRSLEHPFWTTPLDPAAALAPTSADMVSRLAYQAAMNKDSSPVQGGYGALASTITSGSNSLPFDTSFAIPIYLMPTDAPRFPVYTKKASLAPILAAGVPLPDPSLIPGGTIPPSGSDGSVVIISGGEVWELWRVAPRTSTTPTGYDWTCATGGYMANRATHPGIWSGPSSVPPGTSWGVAAAGTSKLGGMLTADDFYAADITHPLGLSLPITAATLGSTSPNFIHPATRFDRKTFVPGGAAGQPLAENYRIPHGARFRLPAAWSDSTINTYATAHGLTAPGRAGTTAPVLAKVLRCLRDYGAILNDSSGVVTFMAESVKTYGTPYNPYPYETAPLWGNFGQQLPWTSLVQVAAPTTDISVPGAG